MVDTTRSDGHSDRTPLDVRIGTLAHRQRGYVKHGQLLAFGLSRQAIQDRVRRGLLMRVHKGVYAVGHLPLSFFDRAAAALLACGEEGLLSHGSAMCLWGFDKR